MKTYKIFLKRNADGKIEDLRIVKNGFDVFALMFQDLYLFYHKMWGKALLFFLFFVLLGFVLNISLKLVGYLIVCSYIAVCFSDWKSKQLSDDGYEFLGISNGNNKKEAKEKFLEYFNTNYKEKDKLEQRIF